MTSDVMRKALEAGYSEDGAKVVRAGTKLQNAWRRVSYLRRDDPVRAERVAEALEAWDDLKRVARGIK